MYKIIADSSCDLKTTEDGLFASVPMLLYTDDYKYLDDHNTPVSELLDYLEQHKGRSYTACPGTHAWIEAFGDADEIYVVCITSGLSGTYNSAVTARDLYREEHPKAKIAVFDSLSTGPEMRMAIEKIQEMKAAGAAFEEIAPAVTAYLDSVHLLFVLNSIHNLAQNGRVSKVIAGAADLLGISVIGIANEVGQIKQVGRARGEKKVILHLMKDMKDNGYKGGKVRISNVQNPSLGERIRDQILKEYPDADILVYPTSGLCSYYAERYGILLGFEC